MSGEPPEQIDLVGAELVRLISAIQPLMNSDSDTKLVMIGGMAVTCRCRSMVRATADVDTVTDARGPLEVVRTLDDSALAGGARLKPGQQLEEEIEVDGRTVVVRWADRQLKIDGVIVDVIETSALTTDDLRDLEPQQRLFLGAHRWALESAESLRVRVRGPAGPFAGPITATLRVATPAALVAMKLASLAGRPAGSPKRSSDNEDIFRLLNEHDQDGAIGDAIAAAPFDLLHEAHQIAQELLVDQRQLRLRELVSMQTTPLGSELYEVVIDEFVEALQMQVSTLG